MTTIYSDAVEIISSLGMNVIVAVGFYISYKEDARSVHDKRENKSNADQKVSKATEDRQDH